MQPQNSWLISTQILTFLNEKTFYIVKQKKV